MGQSFLLGLHTRRTPRGETNPRIVYLLVKVYQNSPKSLHKIVIRSFFASLNRKPESDTNR